MLLNCYFQRPRTPWSCFSIVLLFQTVSKTPSDWRTYLYCVIIFTYLGCYRYTDGSSVKSIDPGIPKGCIKSSKRPECYTTLSISAPLFGYGASQSTTCSVDWSRSLFTANNEPWISFKSPIFNPLFDTRHFKNISLKVRLNMTTSPMHWHSLEFLSKGVKGSGAKTFIPV